MHNVISAINFLDCAPVINVPLKLPLKSASKYNDEGTYSRAWIEGMRESIKYTLLKFWYILLAVWKVTKIHW